MEKLIILDRDGVINYDSEAYIKSPAEWLPIPGSLEAIAKLNKSGYRVAVATNQSGVARGLYSEETLQLIHEKMQGSLAAVGGHVDAIFYCPHGPQDNCDCRKPKPGLFLQIAKHFNCSLAGISAVGDSQRDLEAALAVGCTPILVETGKSTAALREMVQENNIRVCADLASVVEEILNPPFLSFPRKGG